MVNSGDIVFPWLDLYLTPFLVQNLLRMSVPPSRSRFLSSSREGNSAKPKSFKLISHQHSSLCNYGTSKEDGDRGTASGRAAHRGAGGVDARAQVADLGKEEDDHWLQQAVEGEDFDCETEFLLETASPKGAGKDDVYTRPNELYSFVSTQMSRITER